MPQKGVDPRDALCILAFVVDPDVLKMSHIGYHKGVSVDKERVGNVVQGKFRHVLKFEAALSLESEDLEFFVFVDSR